MLFGYFAKPFASDNYSSLGGISTNIRTYAVGYMTHSGVTSSPFQFRWNITGTSEPDYDQQAFINDTFITRTDNRYGIVNQLNEARGVRYTTGTTRALIRNEIILHRPDNIRVVQLGGQSRSRTDYVNLSMFPYANVVYIGNNSGNISNGVNDPIGVLGYNSNLKWFFAQITTTQSFTRWNQIQYRFPPNMEGIAIRNTLVGSIISDRLNDCTKIKSVWLGAFGNTAPYNTPPYTSIIDGQTGMQINGHLRINSPLLEELCFNGGTTLTGLTIHTGATNIKIFKADTATALASNNAVLFRNVLNQAFSSTQLYRLIIRNSNLSWTRNFVNGDITGNMTFLSMHGNILTGTVNFTTNRPNFDQIYFGINTSITNPSLKNNISQMNISGLTNATMIDVSNSRIGNLVLPINTVCTELYVGGNNLDTTVNTSLVNQIRSMTSLTILGLSTALDSATSIENGQNSTNGFGTCNFSTLTSLTSLYAYNVKLSNTLTLPPSLINLNVSENTSLTNISGVNTNFRTLNALNCVNFNHNFTVTPNLTTLQVSNSNVLTNVNLSGKTITTQYALLNFTNNSGLTTVTLPSVTGNCIFNTTISTTFILQTNKALTSINNIGNMSYPINNAAKTFRARDCALNIDFKFGIRDGFTPNTIMIEDNNMSNSNVNLNIDNMFTNRRKWDTYNVLKSLNIGGTNAAPSGTLVAPTGYKTATITGITNATTAKVTVANIGTLANNDVIRIRGVLGMTQVNQMYFMIKNISGNTFDLYNEAGTTPINSTAYSAYTSSGSLYVEGTPANQKEKVFILTNVYAWLITSN